MEDVDKGQPSAHKKEDTEQSRDGGLSKPSSIRFATLKDDDSALSDQDISPNPDIGAHSTRFQTTAEDIAKVDVQCAAQLLYVVSKPQLQTCVTCTVHDRSV